MSFTAGTTGRGAIHYGDEMAVLRGVLASEREEPLDAYYPDDYATRHDYADIPELKDAA